MSKINHNCTISFRWHSHSLSQRADGLFGAFVIHAPLGPAKVDPARIQDDLRIRQTSSKMRRDTYIPEPTSFSERIVLIGDWYHSSAENMLKWYQSLNSFGIVRLLFA